LAHAMHERVHASGSNIYEKGNGEWLHVEGELGDNHREVLTATYMRFRVTLTQDAVRPLQSSS
jgi:hypothetical protein